MNILLPCYRRLGPAPHKCFGSTVRALSPETSLLRTRWKCYKASSKPLDTII